MAASAADAGVSEKKIRQKLIETGDVEAVVSVGNNFFYTRSLPCHVWFFNKNRKDKKTVLMIDARKTFRKVTQTINDFSPEQLEGLNTIIKSYRGEEADFKINDWLAGIFKLSKYEDIKGLCKIISINNIIENDYSLNPGRYVGFDAHINKDFDYQGRRKEIQDELTKLSIESEKLMKKINQ